MAGVYIAFGSIFSLVVLAVPDDAVPFGILQLLAGLAFSLGLILVIVAGAELFTGNTLMAGLWFDGSVGPGTIARAWAIAYAGNFIGSVAAVALFIFATGHLAGDGLVGAAGLEVADEKTALAFHEAFASGILANMLVCLAVWMTFAARTIPGKIIALVPPIGAFVAAGLEHSVANMSLIPFGLLVKQAAGPDFWTAASVAAGDYPTLTTGWMLWNIVWASIGNVLGGGVVAAAYLYSYKD